MQEDFEFLLALLEVDFNKCVSYSQLKRILRTIDYQSFNEINSLYFNAHIGSNGSEWYSLDGKELRGTIDKSIGKKRGISIVNLTNHQSRQSEMIGSYDATKASEKPVISTYLEETDIKAKKLSFDSLHTSVANLKEIEKKEGVYLAQLKGNQKKTLAVCKELHRSGVALKKEEQIEQGHGRIEERTYWGYNLEIATLSAGWQQTGCCSMIVVNRGRYNTKTKEESQQESYWISNEPIDSKSFTEFTTPIRNHWSIEVHHQIRDVQMGEDRMRISHEKEALVVASFITLATNLLENHGGSIPILREKLTKNKSLIHAIFQ